MAESPRTIPTLVVDGQDRLWVRCPPCGKFALAEIALRCQKLRVSTLKIGGDEPNFSSVVGEPCSRCKS